MRVDGRQISMPAKSSGGNDIRDYECPEVKSRVSMGRIVIAFHFAHRGFEPGLPFRRSEKVKATHAHQATEFILSSAILEKKTANWRAFRENFKTRSTKFAALRTKRREDRYWLIPIPAASLCACPFI